MYESICSVHNLHSVNLTFVINVIVSSSSFHLSSNPEKNILLNYDYLRKEGKLREVKGLTRVTQLLKQKQQARI